MTEHEARELSEIKEAATVGLSLIGNRGLILICIKMLVFICKRIAK